MSLLNANGDKVRLNVNNGKTYSLTVAFELATLGRGVMQGFSSSVGDGGRATFTSNVTSGDNFTVTSNNAASFIDLVFASTAASGTVNLFNSSSSVGTTVIRCVFHGARAAGFASNANALVYESEAYDCNKANNAGSAGFLNYGAGMVACINCYSHDHASGSNATAFASNTGSANAMILINCIADTCAGNGVATGASASVGAILAVINSNFYNMTGDAINLAYTTAGGFPIIANNNFIKNAGKGINNTLTAGQSGIIFNNGRGAGTQANGSADTLGCILNTNTDVTYANDVTPWNAPTTGDFRTTLAAAKNAGRGAFTETDGTNTGTVGYPDIGAAQHLDSGGGQKSYTFGG